MAAKPKKAPVPAAAPETARPDPSVGANLSLAEQEPPAGAERTAPVSPENAPSALTTLTLAEQEPPAKASSPTHVAVRAQREGYRRAGIRWSAAWTEIPLARLTEEQLETLRGDPRLTVVFVSKSVIDGAVSEG